MLPLLALQELKYCFAVLHNVKQVSISRENCPVYLGHQLPDPGHDTYFKAQICNSQSHEEEIFIKADESSFSLCWGENLEAEEVRVKPETHAKEKKSPGKTIFYYINVK